jgi:hypothetical protein
MTEKPLPVDEFLSELKASLSEASGEAILRRINAERLLQLLAEEFVETHQAECVRVLPDNRLVGEPEADLLLQIDDYDIRIQLLDAPEGNPVLTEDQLRQLLRLSENNPSTEEMILVWTTDDLMSTALNDGRIRSLLQDLDQIPALLSRAQPLLDVLRDIVARKVKVWETGLDIIPSPETALADSRQLFEEKLEAAIESECGRSYRSPARAEAAQRFPIQKEKQVILDTLRDALNGEPSDSLKKRLTRLPRRGGS